MRLVLILLTPTYFTHLNTTTTLDDEPCDYDEDEYCDDYTEEESYCETQIDRLDADSELYDKTVGHLICEGEGYECTHGSKCGLQGMYCINSTRG